MPFRCAFAGTGYGAHDRHAALPSLALPLRGNRIPTLGPKRFHQGNYGYNVRVRGHLDAGLQQVFDRYDLTAADFAVIVTLRRAGAPYRLPQTQLVAQLGL